jgi:hypothetical protein
MSYDFATVKATVTKKADIPAITRTRKIAENPLKDAYLSSLTKGTDADGTGTWLHLVLPIVNPAEKMELGEVVKDALKYIRAAAANHDMGAEIRTVDNGDGNATVHFRATVKRARKSKAEVEANKA